jgi:hypothetical protein
MRFAQNCQESFHKKMNKKLKTTSLKVLLAASLSMAGFVQAQDTGGLAINSGLAGSWANPDIPGQGFFIDVDPGNGVVFLAWFTYGVAEPGAASIIGHPGNRWFIALGHYEQESSVLILDLIQTDGGVFDDPVMVSEQTVGSLQLNFISCAEAELVFEFDDGSAQGQLQLTRLTSTEVCESLVTQE